MAGEFVPLRIVEWNVAMSLDSKAHLLAALNPTVAVLPESASAEKSGPALRAAGASSIQWVGSNPNKGLLAAAFGRWSLRVDESYDPGYQWVMPLHLSGPLDIRLLAVWDFNHRGSGHDSAKRLGSCRASMDHYRDFLSADCDLVAITGDFNNSVYWDKPNKPVKFADFMDQLESMGYASAYHSHHRCERGAEPHATLWWMRDVAKTYHIDYAFVSRPETVQSVTVGESADWLTYSDHAPLVVDMLLPAVNSSRADQQGVAAAAQSGSVSSGSESADSRRRTPTPSPQPAIDTTRPLPEAGSLREEVLSLLRRADCHYGAALRDEEAGLSVEEAAHKRDQVLPSRIVQLRRAVRMVAENEHSVNKSQGAHEEAVLRALLHFRGVMSEDLRQHIHTRLAQLQPQFGLKRTTEPLRCITRGASARRR